MRHALIVAGLQSALATGGACPLALLISESAKRIKVRDGDGFKVTRGKEKKNVRRNR